MGGMNLSLDHGGWTPWLYNGKYERLKSYGKSCSGMLARSLSLKRANERAKETHCRPECAGDDSHENQHRLSQSIDALFVLSQVKQQGLDWFRSEAFCSEKKNELFRDPNDNKNCNGLWIEELSSMSSEGCHPKCVLVHDQCDLENQDCKFEDKEIVCCVQEETKIVSMEEDARSRSPACMPSEIASRSVEEIVAVVKRSCNPYKDFRDSLMEMILGSNVVNCNADLEELLYCYFSLNSPEHYDLITKAFMEIWIDLQAA